MKFGRETLNKTITVSLPQKADVENLELGNTKEKLDYENSDMRLTYSVMENIA